MGTQLNQLSEDLHEKNQASNYFKFEIGLSGTGLPTAQWLMNVTSQSDIRSVISVIVKGMFDTEDNDQISGRYLKVRGKDGSIQWASKKISSDRPDILTCALPLPFSED
ncbi:MULTISPECIES: hypothetical protein [unclassified Pseudoalteromonas]|uniref:hypothetical protein n=1 Tax=unclassified Pseudoalteromonas TaxID=194690 RepID=UPI0016046D86|nr:MULTISPECIES: hypothetical protein [unclassified Pseudoalteromonas]MBB1295463.1 hypothetical protein [Pseudoalteromonas sp. SR41-4]MBB1410249.1 hypothetical protein [Pseudoalteromonas sp. SG44-17]